MKKNKHIERKGQQVTKIFDSRSLETDYRNLGSILKEGMIVLDVGCGTGAISKDIAHIVGDSGKVVGIDNTKAFIDSGLISYESVKNLYLIHSDLFEYESAEKFDLIVSARVLQWLNNPQEALSKMKSLLKPEGQISILDYNHDELEWNPDPPQSMKSFYEIFLKWRKDAGMNNRIADDLSDMMREVGLNSIEEINSDEVYNRQSVNFEEKLDIWCKVAGSTQMVEEGYLDDDLRLLAIDEYSKWVRMDAISMTMKLNEVRGKK